MSGANGASRTFSRRRLAALGVQLGSFVVILGVPDGLLGVLWPTMHRSLHRPLSDLGEAAAAGTVLYILGGLVADRIVARLGSRGTLLLATVLGLGSLLGWTAAPEWTAVLASLALLGFTKGILDSALNAEAALEGGIRRLGLLHASWAVGGTLGPVVVAALAAHGDWRAAVGVVAAAAALLVPLALLAPHPAADIARPSSARRRPRSRRRAVVVATVVAFFAYTAAEAGPISWGASYLVLDRGMTTTAAALSVAAFWAFLTLGRLALTLPRRPPAPLLLEVSCLLFVAGMTLFWLCPGTSAVVGLPLAGLGSAAVFPLYVALTPERLGAEATGRVVGYSIAGAALGGPGAVWLFGAVADRFGIGALGPCLCGATVVMYLAHRLLATLARRDPLVGPELGGVP